MKNKILAFLLFFISLSFLTSISAKDTYARPSKPQFTLQLASGQNAQGSGTYGVSKGNRIKVIVSNLDLQNERFDYKIVIGKNDNSANNAVWGEYKFIRLENGQCIGTSESYTPAFEGAICNGQTFETFINTSKLSESASTEYYVRLEDSDGSDESAPIKFRLYTPTMYFHNNFVPIATVPQNPLGTTLSVIAEGLSRSTTPYSFVISGNGTAISRMTMSVSDTRCLVSITTAAPQPFSGVGVSQLSDGSDFACTALDGANRSLWKLSFSLKTDSDSLRYDLTKFPTITYTLLLSGGGIPSPLAKGFTVTNENTKYAVIVDNVAGTISCKTSSDTKKPLFNTKAACEETLKNWKWFLIEGSLEVSSGSRTIGIIGTAIQQISCKALDITDPVNQNAVNNSPSFDTQQACKDKQAATNYSYQLSENKEDVVRGCHQDISGTETPVFGTFEACKQELCETLEGNSSDDFDEYCGEEDTPAPPPPLPPCLEFDNGEEGGQCIKIKTAIGDLNTQNASGLIENIFKILLSLSGGIALLIIIYSGYQFMTSQGDPEKVKQARERLTSAIIGLLFLIFSLVILEVVGVDILQLPGFE